MALLTSFLARFKLQLLVVVLAGAMLGAAGFYYHSTQQRIATLIDETAKLRVLVSTQEAENDRLRADAERARVEADRLQQQLGDIREGAAREHIEQGSQQLPPGSGADAYERQANDFWQGLLRDLEATSRGKK